MTLPRTAALCAACLAAGYALRWATAPARLERVITTEVREEVRWRSKVEVVTTRRVDVQTRTRTRWLPSGEVEQVVIEIDRSTEAQASAATSSGEAVATSKGSETSKPVVRPLPDWRLTALVGWDGAAVYGGAITRRLLGPIHAGAWATRGRDWAAGLSVGMEW